MASLETEALSEKKVSQSLNANLIYVNLHFIIFAAKVAL